MSTYTFRFTDNTAKTVKFEKQMTVDDVKKFLINEKEQFFTISFGEKLTTVVRKNSVTEFMHVDEKNVSPSEKQWRIL
jgi:hypothetical protein